MRIETINKERIPNTLLEGLKPYLLLDFFDFPYLTVDINTTGSYFINYYISGKENLFNRILIEISSERLKLFLAGDLDLRQCFDTPENNFVYYAVFDKSGSPTECWLIAAGDFSEVNPIKEKYKFDTEIDLGSYEFTNSEIIKVKSKQRQRTLIGVYLKAPSLVSNLKYWAFKQFLLPFVEMIRASLLESNSLYTPTTLDNSVNLAFNELEVHSLYTTIEISENQNLFFEPQNDKNLSNLFLMFEENEEQELIKKIETFANKKVVIEYLKILKLIIKKDATLNSKFATPDGIYHEVNLNKRRATLLARIIDDKMPDIEDVEHLQGTLLELAFTKKEPTFAMSASFEDLQYRGHISPELTKSLQQRTQEFVFFLKEYIFTIHTKYTPSSSKAQERTVRTLIGIEEVKTEVKGESNES